MRIVLFEDQKHTQFLPLVYAKPVGELLIGIEKIADKWSRALGAEVFHSTRPYLQKKYPAATDKVHLWINARLLPSLEIIEALHALRQDEILLHGTDVLAVKSATFNTTDIEKFGSVHLSSKPWILHKITDLFTLNAAALRYDFEQVTKNRKTQPLHHSNTVIGDASLVFLEEGATAYASSFNTLEGPIYLAKDAEVMEGSHIRGPFALGEHSTLKMASKIYSGTSIGPHCKVGGEVSNSILQGFSNKAHDGFIGNTLIGEWCNLGADSNTSNLKNNYSNVKIFDYTQENFIDTQLTFCGLIMGDHSKCSINTMFNTGTVVGVGANIFGSAFPPKHIPSFTWGGSAGMVEYDLQKMMETAARVYARRNLPFGEPEIEILTHIFKLTANHRSNATQSQD